MRFKLIVAAGVAAFALPVQAQDLMGWSEPSVDWSGFYAGVFAGYGIDKNVATNSHFNFVFNGNTQVGDSATSRIGTLLGGAEIGYDLQYGSAVFGVGADLALGRFSKQSSYEGTIVPLDPADGNGIEAEGRTTWQTGAVGTLTGRLGVAVGNWLLYGTGGLAVADTKVSGYVKVSAIGDPANSWDNAGERSGLLFGSVVGIGVEGMVADNVSVGVEYNYTSFPQRDSGTLPIDIGMYGTAVSPDIGPVSMHSLKLSAKYHF